MADPVSLEHQQSSSLPLLQRDRTTQLTRSVHLLGFDTLDHIVGCVHYDHPQDLSRLCRVSKQMYYICVPWIYRSAVFDFSGMGTTLLQRLADGFSELPRYVRSVRLNNCRKARTGDWAKLAESVLRLARLERFSWDSYADLPDVIHEPLLRFRPMPTLQAHVTRLYPRWINTR